MVRVRASLGVVRAGRRLRRSCARAVWGCVLAALLGTLPAARGDSGRAGDRGSDSAEREPPPRPLRHASALVKEHMQRAQKYFQDQEFARAAEELQQAYSADPRPLYLFNIGQAYRRASMAKEALEFYERFLREDPKNALRGETEGYCNDMRTLIAEQERAAQVKSALSQEQRRAETQQRALREEQERTETTQRALQEERDRSDRERRRPLYKKGWFWGVVGASAAAVALGIGLGVGLAPHERQTEGGFVDINFGLRFGLRW